MESVVKIVLDLTAAVVSLLVVVWVVFITSLQHLPWFLFIALIVFGLTALLALFFIASLYCGEKFLLVLAVVFAVLFFTNAISYVRLDVAERSVEEHFRFYLTAYWGVFSSLVAVFMIMKSFDTWQSLLRKSVFVYAAAGTALFTYAVLSETLPTIASMVAIVIPCVAVPIYLAARLHRL